jgi:hypothetical protein
MTKNITEHYKKYGVIEGDKLLLETAKNNYQKGLEDGKSRTFDIGWEMATRVANEEKAELIEKIKSSFGSMQEYDGWEILDILDTFKNQSHDTPQETKDCYLVMNSKSPVVSNSTITKTITNTITKGCGKEFIAISPAGIKYSCICCDSRNKEWLCPECQARDKK